MIKIDHIKYKSGIDTSKEFIEKAKTQGLKILYNTPVYFGHNINLWCKWFNKLEITNITITTKIQEINENDLCLMIAFMGICPAKHYISIQTENLISLGDNAYISSIENMRNAVATWDYSTTNIDFLIKRYNIQNIIPIPIMFSDNTLLFTDPNVFNNLNNFSNRNFDIIVPLLTPRRINLANVLVNLQLKCSCIWRTDFASLLQNYKVFLNLHAYNSESALEIHRLFDMRNIPIVIISEISNDIDHQTMLDKIIYAKIEDIPALCYKICSDDVLWNKIMIDQQEMWKKFPDDILNDALNLSLFEK